MSVRLDIRCPLGLYDALEGYALREHGGNLSRAAIRLLGEGLQEEGIEASREEPRPSRTERPKTLPLPKGD